MTPIYRGGAGAVGLPDFTWGCAVKGRSRWGFAFFLGKIKELHLGGRGSRIKSK